MPGNTRAAREDGAEWGEHGSSSPQEGGDEGAGNYSAAIGLRLANLQPWWNQDVLLPPEPGQGCPLVQAAVIIHI